MTHLGPFELETVIGRGGMGQIWRAVHRTQGVPVAIKVDLAPPDNEAYRDAFLHEVRLVAGLDHPNVVMVLDHGEVPRAGVTAGLRPGAPWLAMELAGGGSLAGERMPDRYGPVKHVLLELLDALSHAHARGIVHRDIKPGNLLLAGPRDALASKPDGIESARVVLSDFGISTVADRDRQGGAPVGTPKYMAPEQILGQWRDQGPWTDLYSVGVLAWLLTTGAPPFQQKQQFALLQAHLTRQPPAFRPQVRVPDGFEDWVRRLLAKTPTDRFAFAADARRELVALGDPPDRGSTPALSGRIEDEDLPTEAPTWRPGRGPAMRLSLGEGDTTSFSDLDATIRPRNFQLVGAGLGLYGLRAVPMVDRYDERTQLWSALQRVRATGVGRLVCLRGPAGTGKSRLVEWLSTRAHEEGAALSLKAVHTPHKDTAHGLVRMVARHLRTDGMEPEPLLERVRTVMGRFGANGADRALAGLLSADAARRPLKRREQHLVIERMLRGLAGERGVLLWLDDVQWGPDALQLARRLVRVQAHSPFPVLVVVTARDEALAEQPDVEELLAGVLEMDGAESHAVGPLGPEHHRELVEGLLGLEGSLAKTVEERTAGNPLFAVQLVGDWVERGLLVPSARGFRLREGATVDPPDDLVEVWEARLDGVLAGRPDTDGHALELAAVLGLDVRARDWREACALAGIEPSPDLLQELLRRRLAREEGERRSRFQIVHGLFREALLRRARTAGRYRRHAGICATMLQGRPGADPERLARYLLDAGRLEEAVEPLQLAAGNQLEVGDVRSSVLIQDLESSLETLEVPRSDTRWGELWLLWAWLFRVRGKPEEAERWAVRAERAARRAGWDELLPRALRIGGRVALSRGELEEALDLLEEAEGLFVGLGDASRAAGCRTSMGDVYRRLGFLLEARQAYASALSDADEVADGASAVTPRIGLAQVSRQEGKLEQAMDELAAAREVADRLRLHNLLAQVTNLRGEIARYSGDLEEAEACYREAAALFRAFENSHAVYASLNLGIVLVLRGDYAEGGLQMRQLLDDLQRRDEAPEKIAYTRAVLLPCAAAASDWLAFAEHHEALTTFLRRSGARDEDIAQLARRAGTLAVSRGELEVAREALTLALEQYEDLGKETRAAEVRAELARLS